jgi:hypothetical protein
LGAFFVKGANAELAMGMHLLAGGLIWLAPLSGREDARANLLNRLSRLPEAFLPDASETAAPEQEVNLLVLYCLFACFHCQCYLIF